MKSSDPLPASGAPLYRRHLPAWSRFTWRLLAPLAMLFLAVQLHAQSVTSGTISGRVVDALGDPIFDADVSIEALGTGYSALGVTGRDGRFERPLIPPGIYQVRVEAPGYRPRIMTQVPVRPGRAAPFIVALDPEIPPVSAVDTVVFEGASAGWSRPGVGEWFTDLELSVLPDRGRSLADAAQYSTWLDEDLGAQGLPGPFTGIYIDGLLFKPARLPGLVPDPLRGLLFTRLAFTGVEVMANDNDVEWAGSAGGLLHGSSRPGGRASQFGAYGDWSGGGLRNFANFPGTVPDQQSLRGGAIVNLPLVPDSTHLVLGAEAWRTENPRPALFGDPLDAPSGLTGPGLTEPLVLSSQVVTGFARLDWTVSQENRVAVRANVSSVSEPEALTAGYPLTPFDLGSAWGTDLAVAAEVSSVLSSRYVLETRIGVESSSRTFGRSPAASGGGVFPEAWIATAGQALGTDGALAGTTSRTGVQLAPTLHLDLDEHRLKFGGVGRLQSYDYSYAQGTSGQWISGSSADLAIGAGAFSVADAQGISTSFTLPHLGGFAQDDWKAAPGLDLQFGLRFDTDFLPFDTLDARPVWDSLTAHVSDSIATFRSFATRMGLVWDVGERNTTFVRGGIGLTYEETDPGLLHELQVENGRVLVRRGVGVLGGFPGVAPTGATTFRAPRITLIGPDFKLPRTARGSLGLTRTLGGGVAFHVAGSIRRTEFLPRRQDVNLPIATAGTDQFGRPLYGSLLKQGGVLAARPGVNRRFVDFDRVWAVNADGWSDYRGVSLGVERRGVGPLDMVVRYTYSQTEDNLVGARWGSSESMLDPSVGADWATGVSDFDIPHHLIAYATAHVDVLAGVEFSAVYRFQSGTPFTPGFAPGVDANGDGSGFNDPAFVQANDGLGGLTNQWACLSGPASGAIARNACRGPNRSSVDLGLSLALTSFGGGVAELTIEALNVIEPDEGVIDAALYHVDPVQPLSASGGITTVPLQVNPGFGEVRFRQGLGRQVRIGFRIRP